MRILDEDSNSKLDRVTLFLTHAEACELRDDLESLLSAPKGKHAHVSDDEFQKEVTVCVYDPDDLDGLSERSKELIVHDV